VRELTPQEKFILQTIEDEAAREGRPLSDLERRVLLDVDDESLIPESEISPEERCAAIHRCEELLCSARDRAAREFGPEAATQIEVALRECFTIDDEALTVDLLEFPQRKMPVWLDRVLLLGAGTGLVVIPILLIAFATTYDLPDKVADLIAELWDKFVWKFGAIGVSAALAIVATVSYVAFVRLMGWMRDGKTAELKLMALHESVDEEDEQEGEKRHR
jgi:hypothetical protein